MRLKCAGLKQVVRDPDERQRHNFVQTHGAQTFWQRRALSLRAPYIWHTMFAPASAHIVDPLDILRILSCRRLFAFLQISSYFPCMIPSYCEGITHPQRFKLQGVKSVRR